MGPTSQSAMGTHLPAVSLRRTEGRHRTCRSRSRSTSVLQLTRDRAIGCSQQPTGHSSELPGRTALHPALSPCIVPVTASRHEG